MQFDETFWVAVAFVLFVLLVYRPISRFVTQSLDKRSALISHELEEAQSLREEAQALLSSYQRKQKEALQEAEDIIKKAERDTESMVNQAQKDLDESMNQRIKLAMQKIDQLEAKALQEVKEKAVDKAVTASLLLIQEQMNKKTKEQLFSEALKEAEGALH